MRIIGMDIHRVAAEIVALCEGELSKLGSGLIDHNQKATAAAMQIAEKKVWAHRS
jgi:hypothetical protein